MKNNVNRLQLKLLVALCFFFTSFAVFGQSYVGWVTQAANLREGPGTNYNVLETLPAGTEIFIYSVTGENNFYQVKVINTDTDGYISKLLVKLGDIVKGAAENENPFVAIGKISETNPKITIFNNTSKRLTLTLNNEKYVFTSKETKTIIIPAGQYKYMASAPGVIPYFGNDKLENYTEYEWTFYIE